MALFEALSAFNNLYTIKTVILQKVLKLDYDGSAPPSARLLAPLISNVIHAPYNNYIVHIGPLHPTPLRHFKPSQRSAGNRSYVFNLRVRKRIDQ